MNRLLNKYSLMFGFFILLLLNACGKPESQGKTNPVGNNLPTESVNLDESPYGDADAVFIDTPSLGEGSNMNDSTGSLDASDESCLPYMCISEDSDNHLVESAETSSSVEEISLSSESSSSDDVEIEIPKYEIGSFIDSRDNQTYKTVTIGNQTWMGQNLNYENSEYRWNTNNFSYCYANDTLNCAKYGRLYLQRKLLKTVCPDNWHLPTKEEFQELIEFVGGESNAGYALKAYSTWKNGNGSNEYGFVAKASGYVIYGGGSREEGLKTMFWGNDMKGYLQLTEGNEASLENFDGSMDVSDYALSIRCVLGPELGHSSSSELVIHSSSSSLSVNQKVDPKSVVVSEMNIGDNTYKTTKIGSQTWMAENMNNIVANSECYEKDDYYCKKYGRLYTYEAAKQVCNASGRFCGYVGEVWACTTRVWRLPTMDDWKTLIESVGGENSLSVNLRASNVSAGDPYSFSILYAGIGTQIKKDVPWTWEFSSVGQDSEMWALKKRDGCTCTFRVYHRADQFDIKEWDNECVCREDFAEEPYNDVSLYDEIFEKKRLPAHSVRCILDKEVIE